MFRKGILLALATSMAFFGSTGTAYAETSIPPDDQMMLVPDSGVNTPEVALLDSLDASGNTFCSVNFNNATARFDRSRTNPDYVYERLTFTASGNHCSPGITATAKIVDAPLAGVGSTYEIHATKSSSTNSVTVSTSQLVRYYAGSVIIRPYTTVTLRQVGVTARGTRYCREYHYDTADGVIAVTPTTGSATC